ncbi:hypothetical protein MTO96_048436 [Rhipicephalus appendiculatus]
MTSRGEIERPNSPVLSPVTDIVDVKVEPSSPTTVLAPVMDSVDIKVEPSSPKTMLDPPPIDDDPGTPGLTAVASTKQDEMADGTNESHECHGQAEDILCPICERPFSLKRSLKAHMLLHSRTRWFPCSICGKLFQQSSILVHERTHHDRALRQRERNVKTVQCSMCRTIFLNEAGLKTHMRSHTSKRPHECNVCSKEFKDRQALHRHRSLHRENFKCELCPSSFIHKVSLWKHQQLHSRGVDMFHCRECGKMFLRKKSLRQHLRWHTVEMPYACHPSPAKFPQKSHRALMYLGTRAKDRTSVLRAKRSLPKHLTACCTCVVYTVLRSSRNSLTQMTKTRSLPAMHRLQLQRSSTVATKVEIATDTPAGLQNPWRNFHLISDAVQLEHRSHQISYVECVLASFRTCG